MRIEKKELWECANCNGWTKDYDEDSFLDATSDSVILTPANTLTFTAKVPNPDVDYTVKLGNVELPFKTKGRGTTIVTLKSIVSLNYNSKTGKLNLFNESQVVRLADPSLYNRLKDRPNISVSRGNVVFDSPDHITYEATSGRVDDIPISVTIKESKGSIEWK